MSTLESDRQKTLKACREAQHYRNLSEQIRREKRELASSLNEKIELVRDFWRNNIEEGSTRAGRKHCKNATELNDNLMYAPCINMTYIQLCR